jgi:hypothetical protein
LSSYVYSGSTFTQPSPVCFQVTLKKIKKMLPILPPLIRVTPLVHPQKSLRRSEILVCRTKDVASSRRLFFFSKIGASSGLNGVQLKFRKGLQAVNGCMRLPFKIKLLVWIFFTET